MRPERIDFDLRANRGIGIGPPVIDDPRLDFHIGDMRLMLVGRCFMFLKTLAEELSYIAADVSDAA